MIFTQEIRGFESHMGYQVLTVVVAERFRHCTVNAVHASSNLVYYPILCGGCAATVCAGARQRYVTTDNVLALWASGEAVTLSRLNPEFDSR